MIVEFTYVLEKQEKTVNVKSKRLMIIIFKQNNTNSEEL